MTTIDTITTNQIKSLRNAAGEANDLAQIVICDVALGREMDDDDYRDRAAHEAADFARARTMSREAALVECVRVISDAEAA